MGERSPDLWPCVWALASVLSKEFSGSIFVRGDLGELPGPARLGSRVRFRGDARGQPIRVGIRSRIQPAELGLWGDVRGNCVSVSGALADTLGPAHPISCFALAGYLGFGALAYAVGIPTFREHYRRDQILLPFSPDDRLELPGAGISFLGLGQLGQAYLALLYFLSDRAASQPRIWLIDKDRFEAVNEGTQVLLEPSGDWTNKEKALYLAERMTKWGWNAVADPRELAWGFRRPASGPRIALLGFDNFEARRIAMESGFEWIFDGGIGTSLARPRITWHSLMPGRGQAQRVFAGSEAQGPRLDKEYFEALRQTAGGCGWYVFESIRASAPAMGLIAAAYLWSEVACVLVGQRTSICGSCFAWPLLLPFSREVLS